MLDELLDMVSDRSRNKRGASSGGLLGKLGRLLEGDSEEDRRQATRGSGGAENPRPGDPDRSHDDSGFYRREDDDEDERASRQGRKRRAFDLDFGD